MKSKQLKKTQKIKYKKTKTMKKKQKGRGSMFSKTKENEKENTLDDVIQQYATENKYLLNTYRYNDQLDETYNKQKFPKKDAVTSLSIMPTDLAISSSFDVMQTKSNKSKGKKSKGKKPRGSSYKNFSEYMDNIKYREGEQPPHFGGKKKKGK
tara:strand:- start:119 stop:577 length:459 start_codon:yes stop_codon:yes gene_type:complete